MRETKYRRIAASLKTDCLQQEDGTQLPSEIELASRYEVSAMTIRQALDVLEDEGLVTRVFGRGTYVQRRIIAKGDTISSFSDDMRMRGLEPSTRLLGIETILADPVVAHDLRLGAKEKVVRLERLRLADGEPMCLEVSHLPARFASILEAGDLDGSLHAILGSTGISLESGTRRIRAVIANDRQARLLGQPDGSPALNIVQVFSDAQRRPVQRAHNLYRADRYEAYSQVRRDMTAAAIPSSPASPIPAIPPHS
jgi:GntR family transcriptional regulator